MSTFTFCPAYGAVQTVEPKVRTISFGDGYQQLARFGINTQPRSWSLTFRHKKETEADQIEDFLIARAGVESFDWTPPSGASGKWICRSWSRSIDSVGIYTISTNFEEVFEA
jgi:phage-related protein